MPAQHEVRWTLIERALPPEGKLVLVLYKDGMEYRAKRTGNLFFPEGSTTYRYVDPLMWREVPA